MWRRFLGLVFVFPVLVFAEPLDKVVAVVNDNVITQTELDAQVDEMRQQMMAKNSAVPPEAVLRKHVLQHLIEVDLQLQLAKNNDVHIDNTELDATIEKIASDHHLTLTQLREAITQQGMRWEGYRDSIRKEMLMVRLQQQAVGRDVVVSTQQVEDYLKTSKFEEKNHYTYHLSNVVIPLSDEPTTKELKTAQEKAESCRPLMQKTEDLNQLAMSQSTPSMTLEANDLGERHLAELPEVFADRAIKMHVGDVVGPIRTGNGLHMIKLLSINENSEHHYVTKAHVRHILLKSDAQGTAADAQRQANNLYQQLKAGKNFQEMAKKYSLDPVSASKGGDLGWVMSEELVPEVAALVNSLPLNTISEPVKSTFGWHLVEVLARETVDDSDAYQRQQVRQYLQQRKFNEAVQSWKQHIRADAYVNIVDKKLA